LSQQLSQQESDASFQNGQGAGQPSSEAGNAPAFDFRRGDRIAKSQLRAIDFLHETFVRNLVSSLSAYLRSYLSGSVVTVEQLPYADFLEALPSPACLVSLSLRPYDGNAVLELNPTLVFAIIELLLGGKGKSTVAVNREITEIEQNLLDRLFRIIVHDLAETWKAIAPIEFNIESLETEPQFLQIITPTETVVAIGIELRIGDTVGTMNLAIPSITIKMMRQKFDQQGTVRRSESSGTEKSRMLHLLRQAVLELNPQMCGSIEVKDLLNLKAGDILMLDHPMDRKMSCTVNGKPKFSGQIVMLGNKLAFEIADIPEPDGT